MVLNDRVRLEVTDSGNGIQRQDMDRIFDPFFTTKDKTTSSGGIGLGLNTCAEIVKDHRGELYAWSTHGSGSTFTMELPVAVYIDDSEPQTVAPSFGESLSGNSIMVVDDEVTITELIDDYLGGDSERRLSSFTQGLRPSNVCARNCMMRWCATRGCQA